MWVAISDATADNGALRVIPRSHQALVPHTRDPESDHDRRCYPPEDNAVTAELAAGGVLFFTAGRSTRPAPTRPMASAPRASFTSSTIPG